MNLSKEVRDAYGLSQKELARLLNTAKFSVARWEVGEKEPIGLAGEVLKALLAASKSMDKEKRLLWGARLKLGIGALIHYELTK